MRVSFLGVLRAGIITIFTITIIITAVPAQAQPPNALLVGVNFGAVSVEGHSEFGTTVAVLYRFNPVVALGLEIVGHRWTPPALPTEDLGVTQIEYSNPRGRSSTFALTMRVDAPQVWRIVPFGVVGGGVAGVKQTYTVTTVLPSGNRVPSPVGETHVGLQAMGGGGLSLMVIPNGSIDLDVRYIYSQEQPDSGAVRVGAGVSYRF